MNNSEPIPIEDFCEDIVGKAMRGQDISDSELSQDSGAAVADIQAVLRGDSTDPQVLRAIAPLLDLDAEALVVSAEKAWYPEPVEIDGLAVFNTPFGSMQVNAYLVWDPASKLAAVFDSGADAAPMLEFSRQHQLDISAIYLTHTDPDHVADLPAILAADEREIPVYSNRREPWAGAEAFEEGREFSIGSLSVETRHTWGHTVGGTTFVVRGLARPVAAVGDALFAGSQGGAKVSYRDARRTNREEIFTLPDDTIICPGHGPLSSVGEEKRHNPFYPEFKV